MPEVKQPDREVSFKEKFFWTAIVLVIYLFMSQIPVYGVSTTSGVDPFFWLRVILASNRGSLTELGIGPIVTAGLIMQLLQGSKLIKVDLTSPEDRALFTGTQKVMAIALTVFQIIAYLLAGAFGPMS
ncbi:MAG: preprotein translocase subunit SecY, partial [Candidatus Lokiarchaeota archaeon]|nr:preprotein translocase subunit SecY [Candidatus Lokiarchaeota archaeon]